MGAGKGKLPKYQPDHNEEDEKPPFLRSWNRVYGAVLSLLVVLMVLFYLFMRAFT
jgi:hypothetical protein